MNFKFIKTFLFASALLFLISIPNDFSLVCNASEIVTPYADVYVYKYRRKNGILQKRLWNSSKKLWAEPYWHDA